MDTISLLQQALNDFCSQKVEDKSFVTKSFQQIHEWKLEFGEGYALINVGEFSQNRGEFIYPRQGLGIWWLDESTTHERIKDNQIATNFLNLVNSESCPDNHEIFIFMGSIDNGNAITEGRYSTFSLKVFVADPYLTKPSSITSKQIEKRLRRMVQNGVTLLIIDTSNPDFMADNLAKWLREIKRLRKNGDQNFSVIIDSSDEFPAKLPPDLQDECWTIRT